MKNKLQEILNTITTTESQDELWNKVVEYTHAEGAAQLHTWFGDSEENIVFLSTTPEWWHEYYVGENVMEFDHLATHALTGSGPMLYGYDKDKEDPTLCSKAKKLVQMTTSEFKYGSGITMPSFHNNKRIGGINVCFPETVTQLNKVPTDRVLELLLVTSTAHERFHALINRSEHPLSITPRQRECLTWLACGLNPQEIADKLSISYHTVKMHIDTAKERLGAETRIQAVAKALTAGLISID